MKLERISPSREKHNVYKDYLLSLGGSGLRSRQVRANSYVTGGVGTQGHREPAPIMAPGVWRGVTGGDRGLSPRVLYWLPVTFSSCRWQPTRELGLTGVQLQREQDGLRKIKLPGPIRTLHF